MATNLHIVSFDVPYPADYGGVIDVFYRLKALHNLGAHIHLHTFTYGRPEAKELEQYCSEVTYYRRKTGIFSALSRKPYIVQSRESKKLIDNLKKDNNPILLEGLHCCSVLEALDNRRILVRAHNVEHEYYDRLANSEANLFRRIYLRTDARRLKRYEPILFKADAILSVTEADAAHFRSIGCKNVYLMPSSHNADKVTSIPSNPDEMGYALYHANLSVQENIDAIRYLAEHIIPKTTSSFVIAGRNPSRYVIDTIDSLPNARLVPNPDDETMQHLITNAQVHILFTNQPTGLKLKLLKSLFSGRHCLVNSNMVAGTELGRLCTLADNTDEQISQLNRLMHTPFTDNDIQQREQLLGNLYSDQANARTLLSILD
ncbi:MAG: glycosyltransferase family 1 protein [Bacteroidales bacterium]|nr:glycosyltransferase family 1 protein [Bacteroidales bacterium]